LLLAVSCGLLAVFVTVSRQLKAVFWTVFWLLAVFWTVSCGLKAVFWLLAALSAVICRLIAVFIGSAHVIRNAWVSRFVPV